MQIIKITPNKSGSRPPLQSWSGAILPEGYAEVACDTSAFYEFMGFVDITIENGKCIAVTGNQAALDAYLAQLPEPIDPEPSPESERDIMLVDHEYRLTLIELGVM